jgi:hypothetical protein
MKCYLVLSNRGKLYITNHVENDEFAWNRKAFAKFDDLSMEINTLNDIEQLPQQPLPTTATWLTEDLVWFMGEFLRHGKITFMPFYMNNQYKLQVKLSEDGYKKSVLLLKRFQIEQHLIKYENGKMICLHQDIVQFFKSLFYTKSNEKVVPTLFFNTFDVNVIKTLFSGCLEKKITCENKIQFLGCLYVLKRMTNEIVTDEQSLCVSWK